MILRALLSLVHERSYQSAGDARSALAIHCLRHLGLSTNVSPSLYVSLCNALCTSPVASLAA